MSKIVTLEDLAQEERELIFEAEKAMLTAYEPYSKFLVGAAVRTTTGLIFSGHNIENASYGLVVCAERTALWHADVHGYRNIEAMTCMARGENYVEGNINDVGESASCGACRQVIYEYAQLFGHDITLFFSNPKKDRILLTSIYELLPHPFGPADLGVDLGRYKGQND
jgi:cytidine deaminase